MASVIELLIPASDEQNEFEMRMWRFCGDDLQAPRGLLLPALQAKVKQRKESRWAQAPWNCLRILGRSDLFVRLTICISIIGFVSLGLMEVLAQYLQLKLDYTKMDLVRSRGPVSPCSTCASAVLVVAIGKLVVLQQQEPMLGPSDSEALA